MSTKNILNEQEDKLESQEFFDLMQQYRIAPMENQERVIKAFEDVKEWLRQNCQTQS